MTAALLTTVVLIVADDLGKNDLSRVETPHIDQLAADGLSFSNAWACAVCGPARGMLMTGLFPTRTGLGRNPQVDGYELRDLELTLPELIGVGNAFGKWHLGQELDHPHRVGFGYFAGSIENIKDYYDWDKNDNGTLVPSTHHATVDTTLEALMHPAPFLYVAFNAPHKPYQAPPGEIEATREAMIRHMDGAVGRLRRAYPDALFVFVSDNGQLDENGPGGKGSMYETGIGVPLIVTGPGVVRGGRCKAMVNITDLYATVAEVLGAQSQAQDSISMVPYFTQPDLPSLRDYNYMERFGPNGFHQFYFFYHRAVRDERYKLIRIDQQEELFDLENDPREKSPLPLAGPDYQRLSTKMDDWFQ